MQEKHVVATIGDSVWLQQEEVESDRLLHDVSIGQSESFSDSSHDDDDDDDDDDNDDDDERVEEGGGGF